MPTVSVHKKLLTLEEVAQRLGVTSHEVDRLVAEGRLPAYRIGGQFMRFRAEDVEAAAHQRQRASARRPRQAGVPLEAGWRERVREFLYLHDFYLLAALLICLLITILIRFA